MPAIQTQPPALEPVSLAEAKAHLRITHTDDDQTISTLITTARAAVEAECQCRMIAQGWSVFLDRWPPCRSVALPVWPVLSITDVITYGEMDTPATIDPAHYVLDQVSRPARLAFRQGRTPPAPGRAVNGIEIRLTAGFGTQAQNMPAPLRQVVLVTLAQLYAQRGDDAAPVVPEAARQLLAPFRNVRLA